MPHEDAGAVATCRRYPDNDRPRRARDSFMLRRGHECRRQRNLRNCEGGSAGLNAAGRRASLADRRVRPHPRRGATRFRWSCWRRRLAPGPTGGPERGQLPRVKEGERADVLDGWKHQRPLVFGKLPPGCAGLDLADGHRHRYVRPTVLYRPGMVRCGCGWLLFLYRQGGGNEKLHADLRRTGVRWRFVSDISFLGLPRK